MVGTSPNRIPTKWYDHTLSTYCNTTKSTSKPSKPSKVNEIHHQFHQRNAQQLRHISLINKLVLTHFVLQFSYMFGILCNDLY